jgi:hypothetical protein
MVSLYADFSINYHWGYGIDPRPHSLSGEFYLHFGRTIADSDNSPRNAAHDNLANESVHWDQRRPISGLTYHQELFSTKE